jgi:hypothetical protein
MKTLTLVLALLFVVGCVAFVWGQQQATQEQPKKSGQSMKETLTEKGMALSGEIVSVDTAASTITVKEKSGKSDTLKIDPKATLKKAGKVIALKDLSAGEKVQVGYKAEAGEKVATWIGVGVQHKRKVHTPEK